MSRDAERAMPIFRSEDSNDASGSQEHKSHLREGSLHSQDKPGMHSRSTSSAPVMGTLSSGVSAGQSSQMRQRRYFAGAHKKEARRSPWITRPVKGTEDTWVHPEDEATEWLSLFYDLVVVAVLGIFSTQHEVGTPSAIPVFLSFFTVIFWVWVSQTAYDMRYQGNDALNRFFKFIQVCLFIYQGAASGNWNPGRIEVWNGSGEAANETRLSSHEDALRSWLTVVLAFAVSRGILALQYLICAYQGHRADRKVKGIYITVISLCVSLVFAVISAAIPSTSYSAKVAKITIFYLGIVVELADVWVQFLLQINPPPATHKIAERYGAFLIIILGEGIISVSKSFNKAISGLSDDDSGTYVQVFLTVLILYLLWSFLFSNFNKDDHTGHGRAVIWQTLHFPLCFCILLLVAAMVNVVVVLSSAHGVTIVLEYLSNISSSWSNGTVDVNMIRHASRYMNKLSLEPSFPDEMRELAALASQAENAAEDYYVLFDQYAAQVVVSSFELYGMEIPEGATRLYHQLYALNTTWTADDIARNHTRQHADELFNEVTGHILNDAFTGVLWLLPAAGCVLILTAFRSMAWYRFTGAGHWIIHANQIVFGIALGLLGLLDIGPKEFDIANFTDSSLDSVNPLYRILFNEVPLVIVAVVYLIVWLTTSAGLIWIDRRKSRARSRASSGASAGERGGAGIDGHGRVEEKGQGERGGEGDVEVSNERGSRSGNGDGDGERSGYGNGLEVEEDAHGERGVRGQ